MAPIPNRHRYAVLETYNKSPKLGPFGPGLTKPAALFAPWLKRYVAK